MYQREYSCQGAQATGSTMSFQHESSLNMNTLDERLLTVMDVLHTPVWVYDIQRHHIYWANDAALGLWEASSLAELKSRDFSADMAAAIDKIMADPELAKKMGQAGYERARDVFSWESIGDKTVEVYQSVLDEQKK